MLLRVSARFQRHYKCSIDKKELPSQPFPQTWNIDLLNLGRSRHIVLVSEEYSLFSLLIPLESPNRKLKDFLNAFRQRLLKLFENNGGFGRPDLNQFSYCGRSNRSIIGSQNDQLYLTNSYLHRGESPPYQLNLDQCEEAINSAPMSYLEMDSPRKAFTMQVGKSE